jgi:hypothetical protein
MAVGPSPNATRRHLEPCKENPSGSCLEFPDPLREDARAEQEEQHIGEVSIAPPLAGVREFAHVTTG